MQRVEFFPWSFFKNHPHPYRQLKMHKQKSNNKIEMLEAGPQAHSAMEEDLLIARKIQVAMVPQRMPAVEGLEMASLYLPSGAVGGDLFDVIQLTEDVLVLVIFDVAGHGVSAALISAMAKVSFSNHIRSVTSPRTVMERVNSEMIQNISADYYLTAIVAYLDMHDNKLTYCNAGHTYPIIFKRKERALVPLCSTGVFVCQIVTSRAIGNVTTKARASAVGWYVTIYYLGGFVGSTAPAFLWSLGGWPACVAFIVAVLVSSLLFVLTVWRRHETWRLQQAALSVDDVGS